MTLTRRLRVVLIGTLITITTACATGSVERTEADAVNLPRFMGAWHVIAHIPYFAERGHVASRNEYTLREDGKIGVRYVYQEGFGQPVDTVESRASVKAGTGNRRWTVWFFGVVPTRFRVLEVAPDYSWALIDFPERDLAWVFSRTPVMDDQLYDTLVKKMRDYGVNARQLERVPQLPEQLGKPGFAEPKNP